MNEMDEISTNVLAKELKEISTQLSRIADFLDKIDLYDGCLPTFECNTKMRK